MKADQMPLTHTLFEKTKHGNIDFPIQYYVDELYKFSQQSVPLHWHFEPQFYIAYGGNVRVHFGNHYVDLEKGDGIFINGNILHGFQQIDEQSKCQCPNIIFSAELIAASSTRIFQKYIKPLLTNEEIPFFVLSPQTTWQQQILYHLFNVFYLLQTYGSASAYGTVPALDFKTVNLEEECFEMQVQCYMNLIWQIIIKHMESIPKLKKNKKELQIYIRLQLMISYVENHFMNEVKLNQIASAASISKSEAARIFNDYMHCTPIEFVIRHRLETAKYLLNTTTQNIQEVGFACGFNTTSYFIKMFKKYTGLTPKEYQKE
ncbi:helix-turn-helix domain-containing protein [Paenibacillus sp. WLX2291]|uniref:AraC family transcriptional regulator n=1 Tax=Paenibacillus sp. WLX2291 TaxID=3296934 RepID=UPI003983F7A3